MLAHAVAAGALAAAGEVDAAAREVAMLAEAGGWRSEGSYLRSVLVADLADAATVLHDTDAVRARCSTDIRPLTDACGVNGAVVAFAGPFAHAAGILAAELGDHELAVTMLERSRAARLVDSVPRSGSARARRRSAPCPVRSPAATPAGPAPGSRDRLAVPVGRHLDGRVRGGARGACRTSRAWPTSRRSCVIRGRR